jgi:deazaflavin-dependent oxidoreductase (nitroreductase family)
MTEYRPPDLTLVGEEHVRRYLETDGEQGHLWNGVQTLVLTTTGRKSGEQRRSAMIYGKDGDAYVVIASQGGMPTHPNWYHNLCAHPQVHVQAGATKTAAIARTAEGAERDRLWKLMTSIWPNFDTYQTRTDRRIPVVVLDPTP